MSSLRLVLVSALLMLTVACGGYSSSPATPSPTPATGGTSSPVTIPRGAESLANRAFSPDDVNIAVGETVTWTNTDAVAHTSTSDAGTWNSGTVPAGGRFSFTFQTAGSFPYHCTIHPGMVGTVVVR
jgi:plastocyanin